MCNPAGVVLVLVIRFANDIVPRWGFFWKWKLQHNLKLQFIKNKETPKGWNDYRKNLRRPTSKPRRGEMIKPRCCDRIANEKYIWKLQLFSFYPACFAPLKLQQKRCTRQARSFAINDWQFFEANNVTLSGFCFLKLYSPCGPYFLIFHIITCKISSLKIPNLTMSTALTVWSSMGTATKHTIKESTRILPFLSVSTSFAGRTTSPRPYATYVRSAPPN